MKLSKMSQAIEPSLTRKLFNLAHTIDDVIDLTLGDPDFDPASHIKESAIKSIQEGHTHYSANAGLKELRKVYAGFINEEYDTNYNPDENIVVTVGGMEALFLSLAAIVDAGDEVIILGPYYVNYYQMTRMLGGVPVVVDGLSSPDRVVNDIASHITERTVAVILNSPGNPSGRLVAPAVVDAVAQLSIEHDFRVISDEVYRSLIFEGENYSILRHKECADRVVLVDSVSKRYSMTGYRLGFAVADKTLVAAMTKMQENVAACAPLPSQYAAIEAYSSKQSTEICDAFRARRDAICDGLSVSRLICFDRPVATFYLFIDISGTGMKSEEFCYALLSEKHVAVVPGKAYGNHYDNYVRIAFTQDIPVLQEAARRIVDFVEALR